MKLKNIFFILAFVALFIIGCNSNPEEVIVGQWQLSDITLDPQPKDISNEDYKAYIDELISNTSIEFKNDFSYVQFSNGNQTKGTWTILAEGAQIQQTDETSGSKVIMNIDNLSTSDLVLASKDGDIVTKMIFIKK
ncbi:MAG: lipocalin family protein [Bacteroidales bacterium]|nr:lipocalin family protein [Bacteroidales bacterium]